MLLLGSGMLLSFLLTVLVVVSSLALKKNQFVEILRLLLNGVHSGLGVNACHKALTGAWDVMKEEVHSELNLKPLGEIA